MKVELAMYFDDDRGVYSSYFDEMPKYLPKDWGFNMVLPYQYKFIKEQNAYQDKKKFFIHEKTLPHLTEEEVADCEKLVDRPFKVIRAMSKLSIYRNKHNLPDDNFLAYLAKRWNEFFTKYNINLFVMHLVDDYTAIVGFEVAKRRKIPILTYSGGRFTHSFFIGDINFRPVFFKNMDQNEIEKNYKKAFDSMFEDKLTYKWISSYIPKRHDLSPTGILNKIRKFLEYAEIYYKDMHPNEQKVWYSPNDLIKRWFLSFTRTAIAPLFMQKHIPKGEKFFFFPLHFSEDAMITIRFPILDQYKLIEDLVQILPHGVYLYVKPHPHWKCSDVPLSVMKRLSKLENVRFLHYDLDARDLIRNSLCTITINSTVGFESLLLEKKLITYGDDYPEDVVPKIRNSLEFMEKIHLPINKNKYREFVAKTYAHSIFDKQYVETGQFTTDSCKKLAEHIVNSYNFLYAKNPK